MTHLQLVSGAADECPQGRVTCGGRPTARVQGSPAGHPTAAEEHPIDLLEHVHRYMILQGLTEGTIRNYRGKIARWHDWALDEGYDPADVENVIAVRAWSTTEKATESTRQMCIAAMMKLAESLGQDPGLAGGAIERPRRAKPKNWRGLSRADEQLVTDAALAAGYQGTAALIALWAGFRRSEIAEFRWENVDLEQGLMMAYRTKVDDWHIVPIDPRLHDRLEPRHAGEGWLFPSPRRKHAPVVADTITNWVGRLCEEALGRRETPHPLRYTGATRLYEATGDLGAAKAFLGHRSVATTQTYLRLDWRAAKRAMDQMHATMRAAQEDLADSGGRMAA